MRTAGRLLWVILAALLAGCASGDDTGPAEVRWDRDTCTRCNMTVSDRNYAAQVRGGPAGSKMKTYMFDDFGCAVAWLSQASWKDESSSRLWVKDFNNGEWIDMKTAWYIEGHITPMDYGLGAQSQGADGAVGYSQAMEYVLADKRSTSGHEDGHEGHNH
jgi:copper chaperone NosL